ncbi:MAG: hypothetical protein IPN34_17530 [Planctomycetes bacterium]|nr:hypothetical protein [Planctomycetota bacterium]
MLRHSGSYAYGGAQFCRHEPGYREPTFSVEARWNSSPAGPLPVWTPISSGNSPGPRASHAQTYDSLRDRVLLFAADLAVPTATFGETWVWEQGAWRIVSPPNSPSYRLNHSLAYDSVRDRVVLFGGWGGQYLADTWEYDGTSWAPVLTANHPSPRAFHRMAFDAARGRIVLFGGTNSAQEYGDTWEYDGIDWTIRTPQHSPAPRFNHALAYDEARQNVVMFSGWRGYGHPSDTWVWNGADWTELTPQISPPGRDSHAMAYDPSRQVVVLFGGWFSGGARLGDTWEWSGIQWQQTTPASGPEPRWIQSICWDGRRVMLHGGSSSTSALGDTWSYGPIQGAFSAIGSGCISSNGVPALTCATPPRLGEELILSVSGCGGFRFGQFLIGLDRSSWQAIPLPFDLGVLGAQGCTLYIASLAEIGVGTGVGGSATLRATIPVDPFLAGQVFYSQFVSFNDAPLSRALPISASNAGAVTIGS